MKIEPEINDPALNRASKLKCLKHKTLEPYDLENIRFNLGSQNYLLSFIFWICLGFRV
jgi:hypothetical protein